MKRTRAFCPTRFFLPLLLLQAAFVCSLAQAIDLNQVQWKPKMRVGLYHGTFDPFHDGHAMVLKNAIEIGELDYVILIANDLTVHKPNATPVELRRELLEIQWAEHPRVIVAPMMAGAENVLDGILQYLERTVPTVEVVAIIGDDVAVKNIPPHEPGIFNENSLKAYDAWLVNVRGETLGANPLNVPSELHGKPARLFYAMDDGVSSTDVRKKLSTLTHRELRQVDLPLHAEVLKRIQSLRLYQPTCVSLFQ